MALVTGASRGIGRATALALAEAGAAVALLARTELDLKTVAGNVERNGGDALVVPADVRHEDEVVAAVAAVRRRFRHIDILVNNAGIGRFGPVATFAPADWDDVMAVNLRGAFLVTRHVLPLMMRARRGHIINVLSGQARVAVEGASAYCASKYGLRGFTEALALEARPYRVRVTALYPSRTATDFAGGSAPGERRRRLRPVDVARAVVHIVTHRAGALVAELVIRPRDV